MGKRATQHNFINWKVVEKDSSKRKFCLRNEKDVQKDYRRSRRSIQEELGKEKSLVYEIEGKMKEVRKK